MKSDVLKRHRVYQDRVEMPDGTAGTIAQAVAAGYAVEGTALGAAVAKAEARSAHIDSVMALPEADGKAEAARRLAVSSPGLSLDMAARLLAGAPLDADAEAPAVAAPVPLTPQAARLAEIQALGAARRAGR